MDIKRIFDYIESGVEENGYIDPKQALYTDNAPKDYIARGRYCNNCKYFSEDSCALIGSSSETGVCRFFYSPFEDKDKDLPYTPVIDAVWLEEGHILIPLMKEGANIITSSDTINVSMEMLKDISTTIELVDEEGLPIEYTASSINEDTLYVELPMSIEQGPKTVKVLFRGSKFVLQTLDESNVNEYENLSVIIIIP